MISNAVRLSRVTASAIVVLLLVASFINVSAVKAQTATKLSYPYIDVIPNPCQVNQPVAIYAGMLEPLSVAGKGWNITIEIVKPNGETEYIRNVKTTSMGGNSCILHSDNCWNLSLKDIVPAADSHPDGVLLPAHLCKHNLS